MYELDDHNDNQGRYVFYVWSQSTFEQVIKCIKTPGTKEVTIIGPEEWEPLLLGCGSEDRLRTIQIAKKCNVKLRVYMGSVADKLNHRNKHNDFGFENWSNYFGHVIARRHSHGNGSLSYTPPYTPEYDKLEKHFTCMNGRPHWWRSMFIDKLYGAGLFDYGYISWHEWDYEEYKSLWDFEYWVPEKLEFQKDFKGTDGMCDIFVPPRNAFEKSVFSIISESNLDCLFFTEKTYVPIYHQRPFLIWGAPNSHAYLKKIGFKLFDNVIDYSFDSIEDDEKRCEAFVKQVTEICKIDKHELLKLTQSIAKENRDVYLDHLKTKKFVPKELIEYLEFNIKNSYHKQFEGYLECVNSYELLMESYNKK